MAPDTPQQNVWIASECGDLSGEITRQDPVPAEPRVHLNIDTEGVKPREVGLHEFAHHGRRRSGYTNPPSCSVAQVRRGNSPEDSYRASDPSVAQLLRLVKRGNQYRACASLKCGARDRHSPKPVRICLQHHIKMAAGRKPPLQCSDVRRDRIESDLYPCVTP